MKTTYKLGGKDWIAFDKITLSNVSMTDGVTLISSTATVKIESEGAALSQTHIRQEAVEAMGAFLRITDSHSHWR